MLVVGGGPAGTTAANLLARSGRDVLLLDRAEFPRDKVCGDGLAPRSVRALQELGLESEVRAAGYRPLSDYRITSTWGETIQAGLPGFGKGPPYTYVIARRHLDFMLLSAAGRQGVRVMEGARALRLDSPPEEPQVLVRTREGETMRILPRVVIAADGSRASFSRTVVGSVRVEPYAVAMRAYLQGVEGVDDALAFFLDRWLLPGYGWIFPPSKPGDPHNVGVGMSLAGLRRGRHHIRELFDRFVGGASAAAPHLHRAELIGPPASFPLNLDFSKGIRRKGAVLLAGDAANLVDPLSGEGMAYAFESGRSAAESTERYLQSGDPAALSGYETAVWKTLSPEFGAAWLLRQFLVRPCGNGAMIRLMLKDEGIARGGMGVLSNSVPASWLVRPLVWRRVLAPARVRRLLGRPPCRPAQGKTKTAG
ncbi:MAG: geranylgeranyl reductase family protein [Thermoleophilia bacterium]